MVRFSRFTHLKKMPVIGHFGRHDLVSVLILPNLEIFRAIGEIDIQGIHFGLHKKMRVNRVNEKNCLKSRS